MRYWRRIEMMHEEFNQNLVRFRPNLPDLTDFCDYVEAIYEDGWLTNDGPFVRELESTLQEKTGFTYAIAVANGTLGLSIAARALSIFGDFITPSFTFIATPHALHWSGAIPQFADLLPFTYDMDPEWIEALITPHTTGIVPVNVFGTTCDTTNSCYLSHLPVLVDAAHSLGCPISKSCDAAVISLHATKIAHSFEGGAILTDSPKIAEDCARMRGFGFSGQDNIVSLGINAKMSEVHAAMGLLTLQNLDDIIKHNQANYTLYANELDMTPGIRILPTGSNYHYLPIWVERNRDDLLQTLKDNGILARRYFYPGCHKAEPYASIYPNLILPETENLCDHILILPTGLSVDSGDIARVCDTIWRFTQR